MLNRVNAKNVARNLARYGKGKFTYGWSTRLVGRVLGEILLKCEAGAGAEHG